MPLSSKSLAGPGYVILNTIRGMNVVSLLAVICASIMMLVRTVIESQFFFFDAVSHVISACFGIFLIISEVSLFPSYFSRDWPVMSPKHGFGALGCSMLVLGVTMLGNLNKPATTQEALGISIWRMVISSGIIVFVLGFLNILASYVFRDRKAGITSRQVRAHGAVAIANHEHQLQIRKAFNSHDDSSSDAASSSTFRNETIRPQPDLATATTTTTKPPRKRNTNTWSFLRMPFRSDNDDNKSVLPCYQDSPSSRYSIRSGVRELKISAPLAVNPQFAHLVRPESTFHPSRR